MTRNAGNASEKSLKSIFVIFVSMSPPMIIRIGAIAASGMILIKGIKNNEPRNNNPVVTEVNPVLPPAVMPAAVSTVDTVGLVPKSPQATAEIDTDLSDFPFFSGA
ncbi:hypothetical protein D3C81_1520640 [compost metagenome]